MSIKSNNTDIVEVKYWDNNINSIYIWVFLLYIAILINLTLTTNIKDSSFSRASTWTLKDFEWLIKTAKTNEVRFEGVRRVENLLRYSEDFSNNEWKVDWATKEGIVSGIWPNGEDAYEIGMTADTNIFYQTVGLANNKTYSSRILVRAKTGTCNIRIRVSTDWLSSDIELNETWKWVSSNSFPTIGTGNWHIVGGSTNINNFYILKAQLEETTGQVNQNPSEYVSSWVLPAPYHWANADGVKYFNTENGNTVSNNIVIEWTGAKITTWQWILIEPQATNLSTYSNDFIGTDWSVYKITVSNTLEITPTRENATLITETSDNTEHYISNYVPTVDNEYTSSVFAKYVSGSSNLSFRGAGVDGNGSFPIFDLQNGTIVQNGSLFTNVKMEDYGNGWYRCSGTFTAKTNVALRLQMINNYNIVYAGNTNNKIYISQYDVVEGNYISSPIKTGATSVTRIADNLSNTNNKFPNKDICIVMTVTPVVDFADLDPTYIRFFGTYDNRDNINKLRTFGNTEYGLTSKSGLAFLIKQSDFIKDVETKVAFSLKQNGSDIDAAIYKDWVKVYSTTVANMTLDHSNLNKMTIGNYYWNTLVSNFKDVKVFESRTDAQLISLTTI